MSHPMKNIAAATVLVLALAACAKTVPDDGKVWIQKSMVPAASADFRKCVAAAVGKIGGLTIEEKGSTLELVQVATPLRETIAGLHIEIRRDDQGMADIQFIGNGMKEPDEARQAIAPLLRELSSNIGAACVGR